MILKKDKILQWTFLFTLGALFLLGVWLVLHYPGEEIMWTGLSILIATACAVFVKSWDTYIFTGAMVYASVVALVIFADKHQAVLLWLILTSAILLITLRRKGLLEGFGTLMRNYKTELTCYASLAFGTILLAEILFFGGYPLLQKLLGWIALFILAIFLIIVPCFAFLISRIRD